MHKSSHLIIDCCNVSRDVCLDDRLVLETIARAATRAGATVISQNRYRFWHDSPPGFTAVVLLDESHVTAHSYADLGLLALDIFTCGDTDPMDILRYTRENIDLGKVSIRELTRFPLSKADPVGN